MSAPASGPCASGLGALASSDIFIFKLIHHPSPILPELLREVSVSLQLALVHGRLHLEKRGHEVFLNNHKNYVFQVRQHQLALKVGQLSLEVLRPRRVLGRRHWQPSLLSFFVLALPKLLGLLTDPQRFIHCILDKRADI